MSFSYSLNKGNQHWISVMKNEKHRYWPKKTLLVELYLCCI